jgi:hypothetical protein
MTPQNEPSSIVAVHVALTFRSLSLEHLSEHHPNAISIRRSTPEHLRRNQPANHRNSEHSK